MSGPDERGGGADAGTTPPVGSRADDLRRAFDRSFAQPPAPAAQDAEDLLAIGVEGDLYAVRLAEIAGIVAGRAVIAVPAAAAGLLGLANIRGQIVPVFGLAALLGYQLTSDSPRWALLCAPEEPLALAFAQFQGYLRIPRSSLHAADDARGARRYVSQIARTNSGVRAVISIPRVLADITHPPDRHQTTKEQ